MNFDISDEQKMLAEHVQRLLGQHSSPDRLRELIRAGAAWDAPLWRELAEMGVLGAAIEEEHGGLGLTDLDLCVVAQELGRANAAVPFMSSIGLAAEAIRIAGTEAQKHEWLPRIASGEIVATFAYAEGSADIWSHMPTARFADGTVSGIKWPVADLSIAQLAIVTCRSGDDAALALVELGGGDVAIRVDPLESIDQLRSQGRLVLDGARAELLPGCSADALERILDRAAILTAFEQIGAAERCLYMVRDYALERQIFARPLASYQAIKHKLADIFVLVELARSNAYFAAWAAMNHAPEAAAATAAARLSASEALEQAARDNVHLHGGIGYTFEADCHFFFRRERLLAVALGGRERWNARLIEAVTAPEAASGAPHGL